MRQRMRSFQRRSRIAPQTLVFDLGDERNAAPVQGVGSRRLDGTFVRLTDGRRGSVSQIAHFHEHFRGALGIDAASVVSSAHEDAAGGDLRIHAESIEITDGGQLVAEVPEGEETEGLDLGGGPNLRGGSIDIRAEGSRQAACRSNGRSVTGPENGG